MGWYRFVPAETRRFWLNNRWWNHVILDNTRLYQVYCIFFLNILKCKTICEMPKKENFSSFSPQNTVLDLMAGRCLLLWIVWNLFLRVALSLSLDIDQKIIPKVCLLSVFLILLQTCLLFSETFAFQVKERMISIGSPVIFYPYTHTKGVDFYKGWGGLFVRRIDLTSHDCQLLTFFFLWIRDAQILIRVLGYRGRNRSNILILVNSDSMNQLLKCGKSAIIFPMIF